MKSPYEVKIKELEAENRFLRQRNNDLQVQVMELTEENNRLTEDVRTKGVKAGRKPHNDDWQNLHDAVMKTVREGVPAKEAAAELHMKISNYYKHRKMCLEEIRREEREKQIDREII